MFIVAREPPLMPKCDVVLTVHNTRRAARDAIASELGQTRRSVAAVRRRLEHRAIIINAPRRTWRQGVQ